MQLALRGTTTASGDPIMSDDATLLTALQHADSFFPGGGSAFSWGLESLCNDRQVASAADVERFLAGQLRHRWASCDRPFLAAAIAPPPTSRRSPPSTARSRP